MDRRLSYEKVTDVYASHKAQTLVRLTLDDGQTLTATEDHPFKTTDGWRDAIMLKKGGKLLLKGGDGDADAERTATIAEVRTEQRTLPVYNLEVANGHTYFVSKDGLLVHNLSCFKFPRWRRGDPIDKILPNGISPNWETVRPRYWKNRYENLRVNGNLEKFSERNLDEMRRGNAPLDYNAKIDTFERRELHHVDPQRNGGANNPFNLREVTPDQHRAIDPYRK